MVQESPQELAVAGTGWVQDELYQVKADVGQIYQQLGQLHALASTVIDNMRAMEATLREAAQGAAQAPRLQEELNMAAGLLVQLQDQQAEAKERLDYLMRHRQSEEAREHQEWADLARRLEVIERQVEHWQDRQAGVDEVGRRFQENLSLVLQQLQQIDQRLEGAESKASRALEGANRTEHTLTETQAAVVELRREDETLNERTRVTAEVARRLEATIGEHLQELRRIEMLAERIELHRAERQRLEDRALRLEEELGALRTKSEEQEHQQGRLHAQAQGLASRLDTLHAQVQDQRVVLVDQIRKLTGTQERTKRRQIQETEREIREMKQYVAGLADQ
jgi:chromosome segregation ATPase